MHQVPSLPGYDVEGLLGAGGEGRVWVALEQASGRRVALKVVSGLDPHGRYRLHREAALQAGVVHPHVLRILGVQDDAEEVVLVLELADGGSLLDLVTARGALSPGEVVTACAPIAQALGAVHQRGLVHGDVSCANILFTVEGRPLLADLGVARLAGEQPDEVGITPGFTAPEVLAGSVPGPPADVYSLAVAVRTGLVGVLPDDPRAAIVKSPPLPATPIGVIERALGVEPRNRPSADELADALFRMATPEPLRIVRREVRQPTPEDFAPVTHRVPRPPAAPAPASDAPRAYVGRRARKAAAAGAAAAAAGAAAGALGASAGAAGSSAGGAGGAAGAAGASAGAAGGERVRGGGAAPTAGGPGAASGLAGGPGPRGPNGYAGPGSDLRDTRAPAAREGGPSRPGSEPGGAAPSRPPLDAAAARSTLDAAAAASRQRYGAPEGDGLDGAAPSDPRGRSGTARRAGRGPVPAQSPDELPTRPVPQRPPAGDGPACDGAAGQDERPGGRGSQGALDDPAPAGRTGRADRRGRTGRSAPAGRDDRVDHAERDADPTAGATTHRTSRAALLDDPETAAPGRTGRRGGRDRDERPRGRGAERTHPDADRDGGGDRGGRGGASGRTGRPGGGSSRADGTGTRRRDLTRVATYVVVPALLAGSALIGWQWATDDDDQAGAASALRPVGDGEAAASALCGGPAPAPTTQPPAPADWSTVVEELNELRSTAFADADPAELCAVYVPTSETLKSDIELMQLYERRGVRAQGFRFEVSEVTLVSQEAGRVVLEITDELPPYPLVDEEGETKATQPGKDEMTWRAELLPAPDGSGWRFG